LQNQLAPFPSCSHFCGPDCGLSESLIACELLQHDTNKFRLYVVTDLLIATVSSSISIARLTLTNHNIVRPPADKLTSRPM
jgi:hypothetical protein